MSVDLGFTADRGAEHTVREIAQQPEIWRQVARTVVSGAARGFLAPLLAGAEQRIVLTGAGSSAFIGEVLAGPLGRELNRRVDAVATTDIVSNPADCFAAVPTLLVSLARSGDSPESIAATQLADRLLSDVHHLVVTCNSAGALRHRHDGEERSCVLLMPDAANDRGFAMTASFTSMLFATRLAFGSADEAEAESLAAAVERELAPIADSARELAERGHRRVVFLGSGPLKGVARESSLKLLELSGGRVDTYFDSPLGFRHGPKSVLDERTLVVLFLSNDPYTRRYDEDMLAELRLSLRPPAGVVVVGARPPRRGADLTWLFEGLDDAEDVALALPFVTCGQLVGLAFSLALGGTPDNPFPHGEVNRVVQGVTVHSFPPPPDAP
jgi:tagatose-6-phosphate ketose/aldose isomerase